jgi:hypothetical protein
MSLPEVSPDFLEWLFNVIGYPITHETAVKWSYIFILVVIILIVIKFISKRFNIFRDNKALKWRKQYCKNELGIMYDDFYAKDKLRYYIPVKSQTNKPHDYNEPFESVSAGPRNDLVQFMIKNVFVENNLNKRLYLMLAGSGMGKTTLAVHLFVEYVNHYKEKTLPFDIHFLNMNDQDVLGRIQTLASNDKAKNEILILDALDENLQAVEDFQNFKNSLEQAFSPFRFVVVTCRTQFFESDENVPNYSSIIAQSSEKNFLHYNKVYISPFSKEEIDVFINKKYKNKAKRKMAQKIIDKCNKVYARPLLLNYLDDLLDQPSYDIPLIGIYEILIEKWLERETSGFPESERDHCKEELYQFSLAFARRINSNWRLNGRLSLSKDEFDEVYSECNVQCNSKFFRGRSLINHDAYGNYKFAHKSFFEYFLANASFKDDDIQISWNGMSLAKDFYKEFCKTEALQFMNKNDFELDAYRLPSGFFTSNIKLIVHNRNAFNYAKCVRYLKEQSMIVEVDVQWGAYDDNIESFLVNSEVSAIIVRNYNSSRKTLKAILKTPKLQFILLYGEKPANKFLKAVEKMGICLLYENKTYCRGLKILDYAPYEFQIQNLEYNSVSQFSNMSHAVFKSNLYGF